MLQQHVAAKTEKCPMLKLKCNNSQPFHIEKKETLFWKKYKIWQPHIELTAVMLSQMSM